MQTTRHDTTKLVEEIHVIKQEYLNELYENFWVYYDIILFVDNKYFL